MRPTPFHWSHPQAREAAKAAATAALEQTQVDLAAGHKFLVGVGWDGVDNGGMNVGAGKTEGGDVVVSGVYMSHKWTGK